MTFAATLVNTVTGFGLGIISVMAFSFVIPVSSSVALTALTTVAMGIALTCIRIRHVRWRLLALPVSFSVVSGFLCVYIGSGLPQETAKRMLGVFLLLLSVYFFFYASRVKLRATVWNGTVMGILSGAFTGLFGIGGPPMVLYYIACLDDKSQYMATSQMHFLAVGVCMLILRIFYHQITVEIIKFFAAALLPMSAAVYLGTKLFNKLNEEKLRKIIYFFMALCGGYFMIAG